MHKSISGVHAAVSTPRLADGALDENSLRNILRFLLESGIRGFALNGATAEYCVVSPAELLRILEIAREMLAGLAEFVCGIGSAGIHGCLSSGRAAIDAGAKALLLPTPHFFPYQQSDLYAFCREVASRLPAPILLYNLPQFTTGLEAATVIRLVADCPNIIGIKDSSGSLDILRALQTSGTDACRIVGNDSILAEALRNGLCDGVISGVACALPELILGLYRDGDAPDSLEFLRHEGALKEFIGQLADFPVPWGLKWIAEARGIAPASFAQPVSAVRLSQARELQAWFRSWHAGAPQEAVNT
jgi:4-hydroxy-tetrahydrodipicolinate synthase